ncbi:MAG TPA: Na+/H+ antiporter subunit E [Paenalcaligenes sp.]|nr:Na+/H+ antiporter subunit E [Paenalcaligenes sp.]
MKGKLSLLYLPAYLLGLWLLLNNSLSIGNIALGIGLGLFIAFAALPFRPVRAAAKKPLLALKLLGQVWYDIIVSNIDVGRIVWLGSKSGATPGFLDIPLTIKDPHGLAALSCIVSYTPGTVWSGYDEDTNMLTLHILDLKDEQQWLDTIQKRYQNPLIEIFE